MSSQNKITIRRNMRFAKALAKILKEQGLQQVDIIKGSNGRISFGVLWHWLQGRNCPSRAHEEVLCEVLGVTSKDLSLGS